MAKAEVWTKAQSLVLFPTILGHDQSNEQKVVAKLHTYNKGVVGKLR